MNPVSRGVLLSCVTSVESVRVSAVRVVRENCLHLHNNVPNLTLFYPISVMSRGKNPNTFETVSISINNVPNLRLFYPTSVMSRGKNPNTFETVSISINNVPNLRLFYLTSVMSRCKKKIPLPLKICSMNPVSRGVLSSCVTSAESVRIMDVRVVKETCLHFH